MPANAVPLEELARIPAPGDNAAIALRDLARGTRIRHAGRDFGLQHDVLTGHRFAAVPIPDGTPVTSWNYPFGRAARDIAPGEYLCNHHVWFRLSLQEDEPYRSLRLPAGPNFTDDIEAYAFDPARWRRPEPPKVERSGASFMGYDRGPRGTGTRNHLVILGTSSTTQPLIEALEERFQGQVAGLESVDAVVGLRHTEGGETSADERERTLRTLAGLLANPNVGAFLVIDSGRDDELGHAELLDWMAAHGLAADPSRARWMSAGGSFASDLAAAGREIRVLLDAMAADRRSPRPLAELRIGLQCGASDAFSGICGNVLSGSLAREVIRHGGSANLTETPELSGAEDYLLSSIADPAIAPRFLAMLERFKEQLGWHGGKVDKNPSEGNLLGGLYNITLKSLGAAVKRPPDVPIRHVLEHAERMTAPGYHFMDGMGGDIASYTGQAAAGCNLLLFVTGRGSPTNSSIVPTIKIVNTTRRYEMMAGDIDINAGRYLEGTSMEELTRSSLARLVAIASGTRTKGERRSQNIDLTWRRRYFATAPRAETPPEPSRLAGEPLAWRGAGAGDRIELPFAGRLRRGRVAPDDSVGLLLPTVGCSVATARLAARRLNEGELVRSGRVSRFVTLSNTEGCGVTTGAEVLNFLLGYANHPRVEACLFLSLGCEMVSPGFLRALMRGEDLGFPEISAALAASPLEASRLGWLTIQESGGSDETADAAVGWFREHLLAHRPADPVTGTAADLRVAFMSDASVSSAGERVLAACIRKVVASGGTVVLPAGSRLLERLAEARLVDAAGPTLAFAQPAGHPGLHVMQMISDAPLESLTGLGAASDIVVHLSNLRPVPGHSLVPTLNLAESDEVAGVDLTLGPGGETRRALQVMRRICEVLSGQYHPVQNVLGNVGNQIPRGARAHAI